MSDSWSMSHNSEGNFLHVTFSEDFVLAELDTVAQTLESRGHTQENRLFDFLQSTELAPTTTELLDLARRSADWDLDNVKVAWLAANQTHAGLLRIITTKFSEQVMKVFTSEPEARRWLTGKSAVTQDSPGRVNHYPVRLRGLISADIILQKQQEVRDDENYKPEQPLLWDLRECQINESLDSLKEMAVSMASNYQLDKLGFKAAILIDSHFIELIVREMAKATELDQDSNIVIFRSYRDAMAWLAK